MQNNKYNFSVDLEYEDPVIGAISVTTKGIVPASDIFAAMENLKEAFGEAVGTIVSVELDLVEENGFLRNETAVNIPWTQ